MQVQVHGSLFQDGRGGEVGRCSAALRRGARRGAVAILAAACMLLGGLGWAVPARAVALKPVVESPQAPGPRAHRDAPILRRAGSPRSAASGHPRNATSRKRSKRRASVLASAVGHSVRAVKKPRRREPPRQRPIDHAHLAQSHGIPVFAVPDKRGQYLAHPERGPPRAHASKHGSAVAPASQSLDIVAADLLGSHRAGRRTTSPSFESLLSNETASLIAAARMFSAAPSCGFSG